MAPTPPNHAQRIRAHYTGPFGSHTMLFHSEDGVDLADFIGDVQDAIDQIVGVQYQGTTWGSAELAGAGSNLFFPVVDWTPIVSTSGFDGTTGHAPSAFVQFGGRSTVTGKRAKLYVFETYLQPDANMRITPGESTPVSAVITELNSVDSQIGAIDGTALSWYPYANLGQNDHLTHKARG